MKKYSLVVVNTLFLILFLSCKTDKKTGSRVTELPYYTEATFTPLWMNDKSEFVDTLHTIPNFSFIDQEGDVITNATFKDKIYITNFFFTSCPGICPKMTSNMTMLQDEFIDDSDVLLLSHSVTPETDSVSVLKNYAKEYGIDADKWHLVTGNQQEIYSLGRKSYFVEEDLGIKKSDDEFLHTENFVLIDKERHIRGIYNGLNRASIQQLILDIKALKKE
ncbi:SCO family protein [Joostella atrarenae]|uniref:SCO family protein n=2 Tax=Joostella atrarenae TaxID=679257 RepID=A0ABS9J567_9FLAO|nr:SCO family protein [Joostella atrarenae]MCF8715567.1 SCO family protein [Joostella atrarenae]